jgi:hypothetical protein
MNVKISTLFFVASITISGLAFADADDATWIAQCIADNKKEGASPETVKKYCECMNDHMSGGEMQSITQWEEAHPKERKECEAKAGWE